MKHVLKNLPVHVSDEDVESMIKAADADLSGNISLVNFCFMIGYQ